MMLSIRSSALLCTLALGGVAGAALTTFDASADARILSLFGDSNFQPDFLSTYNEGGNQQRTLIRFDLSGIPTEDVILSATLRLYGTRFGGFNTTTTMDVYRLTEGFEETQVTWNRRNVSTAWTTGGGTSVGKTGTSDVDPYATRVGLQDTGWFEWDVKDLVAEWHAGTHANHGVMIRATVGNTLTFTSREGLANAGIGAEFTPELVVEHDPVPEPASLLALAGGVAALARRRKRS